MLSPLDHDTNTTATERPALNRVYILMDPQNSGKK